MFFSLLLASILGICCGIITGLIPGIHVNLISVFLLSLSPLLLPYTSVLQLAIIILSMAITHSFLDTIPSIFLGVPEEDTALSILPGHRMVLEGKGLEAVYLTIFGSFFSLLLALSFLPLFFLYIGTIYSFLQPFIGWLLVLISLFMIVREKNIVWAAFVFALCGVLGLVALDFDLENVLFPLFSGLFGVSMLLLSLYNKTEIPSQEKESISIDRHPFALIAAVIMGWCASFLPGLGPAQAAVIASQFVKLSQKGFLVLVGGLSTTNMVLSLLTFYVLDKARNGAVVAISDLLTLDSRSFLILLAVVLFVGGSACMLALSLAPIFSSLLSLVNYRTLCVFVICLIVVLVLLLTGWLGLLILLLSTAVGIIPAQVGVSRSHMMACLLVPVIGYFLF